MLRSGCRRRELTGPLSTTKFGADRTLGRLSTAMDLCGQASIRLRPFCTSMRQGLPLAPEGRKLDHQRLMSG
jgi:hypothetical protein